MSQCVHFSIPLIVLRYEELRYWYDCLCYEEELRQYHEYITAIEEIEVKRLKIEVNISSFLSPAGVRVPNRPYPSSYFSLSRKPVMETIKQTPVSGYICIYVYI